jgi:hypothetical protein
MVARAMPVRGSTSEVSAAAIAAERRVEIGQAAGVGADARRPSAAAPAGRRAGTRRRCRADEVVLAGDLRGFGAARIEQHQLAARGQRLQPLRHAGAVIRLPLEATGLAPSIRK